MIEELEKVKLAYRESTTQIDRIIVDNIPYRITKIDYNDDCYEDGNVFGTAIARMLEFEIENNINLEKKEFEYQTGIYIGNEIFWTSLGNFITQDVEPSDTSNINKVTSYDYMLKSDIPYKTELDYKSGKVTMLDVLMEACNNSELELVTKDFANKDFIVDSNQFSEGTLNRQVFKAVAQMSGSFAKIRSDNKLHFITPKKTENAQEILESYNRSDYSDLVIKRNTHPINLVSLGMTDIEGENVTLRDEESIAKDGENSLVFNNNPFAYTQQKREELITNLFNTVKGFEYTGFELQGQFKPYLETGDEILIKDKNKELNHSFVFRFRFQSPNGLESTIEAPSIIKATVNYQNALSALDVSQRTEYWVDKEKQTITGLVKKTEENNKIVSTFETSLNGIKGSVENTEKEVTEISKKAVISVKVLYAQSTSQTVAPTEDWQETAPVWEQGKYIWTKSITTYANGEQSESSATCISGADGKSGKDGLGITRITPQYYLSSSNTNQTGGSWKNTQDPWKENYFYWTRSEIEWTDKSVTHTSPILDTGINELNEKIKETSELLSETSSSLELKMDSIESNVQKNTTATILTLLNNGYLTAEQVNALVSGNSEDIATIKEQLKQTVTSSQMQIEITKAIEGGVSYLKNTLFTIDENGMAIATDQDEFNALYNNKGMYLYSFDELIARYDKDGAYFTNLEITGELRTKNIRVIDDVVNGENRTQIHWIGG